MNNIELQDILLTIAITIVGIALKWIKTRIDLNDAKAEAFDEIFAAVAAEKNSYVDDLKAKSADGTLTDEEKKQAVQNAVARIMKNAGPKALKLITEWGEEKVKGYIELAVTKLSK